MLNCFSCVRLSVTLWTTARQGPLSMRFSRQEYWSGLPCLPPGNLPNLRIKLTSLKSPALPGGFFTTSFTWEALNKLLDLPKFPSNNRQSNPIGKKKKQPGGPVVKTSPSNAGGAGVQSLVGEQRSHMLPGQKTAEHRTEAIL